MPTSFEELVLFGAMIAMYKKNMKTKDPMPKEANAKGERRCPSPSQEVITSTKPDRQAPVISTSLEKMCRAGSATASLFLSK